MEALHDDRLADIGFGDDQRIDIEVVIVLGVGDGDSSVFLTGAGDALAREFEIGSAVATFLPRISAPPGSASAG
jgi:hypothetical protein